MWQSQVEISGEISRKVLIRREGRCLSYARAIELWQHDASFRTFFTSILAEAPFAAYFWETPPVSHETLEEPFEFVLVDSVHLATVLPNPRPFEGQFAAQEATDGVVTFENLGGDAVLVVPCPLADESAYPHLAAFVRHAPARQKHALWAQVGAAMAKRVGRRPMWLSTAGMGVYWLHVRLDSRPKYYTHGPYKSAVRRPVTAHGGGKAAGGSH